MPIRASLVFIPVTVFGPVELRAADPDAIQANSSSIPIAAGETLSLCGGNAVFRRLISRPTISLLQLWLLTSTSAWSMSKMFANR
jgi:hypothetical protein